MNKLFPKFTFTPKLFECNIIFYTNYEAFYKIINQFFYTITYYFKISSLCLKAKLFTKFTILQKLFLKHNGIFYTNYVALLSKVKLFTKFTSHKSISLEYGQTFPQILAFYV